METGRPTKVATSIRLSEEAKRLWQELADMQAISLTAALEILIRKEAEEKGIYEPKRPRKLADD